MNKTFVKEYEKDWEEANNNFARKQILLKDASRETKPSKKNHIKAKIMKTKVFKFMYKQHFKKISWFFETSRCLWRAHFLLLVFGELTST